MACNPCHSSNGYASHRTSFPRPPAQPQQPPLLPLPAQAPPPVSRTKKPRCHTAAPGASAPITVAAPSKKRVAPATTTGLEVEAEWTAGTDSLYSVSPPPSSVPMPTSLLLTVTAARKAPSSACCAVEVAGAGCGGVDVGATDELRRLLRL